MLPYSRPYFNSSELLAALSPGNGRSDFESAIATLVGARYGIAFSFGRSAMIAVLKGLGLRQAEVVLPAYTCEVMAQAVTASGNYPAFVDIKLSDYNMDLNKLERALTPQTRVVVATHLFGYPTNVDAIRNIIGDSRITLLEDCAQGLLTFSPGTSELRGDLGLFSFGPLKHLCTVQGGVIVTNSSDLYEKIKAYRDKEMNLSSIKVMMKRWTWLLTSYVLCSKSIYGLLYWYRYQSRAFGKLSTTNDPSLDALPADIAVVFSDFQARIGLEQLRKLDIVLAKRRALAMLYDQELRDLQTICPAPTIDAATYSFYILRVPRRDEIGFKKRMAKYGVNVDQSYDYALPYLESYRSFAREAYPCALQAAREVVNLPCYPGLSMDDARFVAKCVRNCVQELL